jgi:hypothetical protein
MRCDDIDEAVEQATLLILSDAATLAEVIESIVNDAVASVAKDMMVGR